MGTRVSSVLGNEIMRKKSGAAPQLQPLPVRVGSLQQPLPHMAIVHETNLYLFTPLLLIIPPFNIEFLDRLQ